MQPNACQMVVPCSFFCLWKKDMLYSSTTSTLGGYGLSRPEKLLMSAWLQLKKCGRVIITGMFLIRWKKLHNFIMNVLMHNKEEYHEVVLFFCFY
jgi:hypothetical protein